MSTIAIIPIIAALLSGSTYLGHSESLWTPQNPTQVHFIKKYMPERQVDNLKINHGLNRFSAQELTARASNDYQVLNGILEDNGYSVRFDEFESDSIGLLAIMNISVSWLQEGNKSTINFDNKSFPAVEIKWEQTSTATSRVSNFDVYKVQEGELKNRRIVSLATRSGDIVYMMQSNNPKHDLQILEIVENAENAPCLKENYTHVRFPMVSLYESSDLNWLIGMIHSGFGPISEAKAETTFTMDEKGAIAKSASAAVMTRSAGFMMEPNVFVVDKPFYLWIRRPSVSCPVFAGYITPNYWKKTLIKLDIVT